MTSSPSLALGQLIAAHLRRLAIVPGHHLEETIVVGSGHPRVAHDQHAGLVDEVCHLLAQIERVAVEVATVASGEEAAHVERFDGRRVQRIHRHLLQSRANQQRRSERLAPASQRACASSSGAV